MKSYEKFNFFGFVSKFKSIKPLAKRHKIMNLRKGVLDPRKGKTYIPEALVRFFLTTSSRQATTPSLQGPGLNYTTRHGGQSSCLGTYFDVSKTTSISSFFKI